MTNKIIIEGVTESGEIFRPSDWAERMCGQLSTMRKRRVQYSPLLQPSTKNGIRCVLLDRQLKETHSALYHSILDFVQKNNLKMSEEGEVL